MPTEDAYSSGHLVLSHFGACMCSNVETNLSWTCLVSGLLNFEHPSVLLFCLLINMCLLEKIWLAKEINLMMVLYCAIAYTILIYSYSAIEFKLTKINPFGISYDVGIGFLNSQFFWFPHISGTPCGNASNINRCLMKSGTNNDNNRFISFSWEKDGGDCTCIWH